MNLRDKTLERRSFFRWAQQKVTYLFTGLYGNLSVPLQRETRDEDHHKRCSLWRVPETHRAQAEEVKGGNTFTPAALQTVSGWILGPSHIKDVIHSTCKSVKISPCFPLTRSIYQKFRNVDILDKKKTVTALKPGEDRAILLGLGMILSSVMLYFVLGITVLRSYADRYRSDKACCVWLFLNVIKWNGFIWRQAFNAPDDELTGKTAGLILLSHLHCRMICVASNEFWWMKKTKKQNECQMSKQRVDGGGRLHRAQRHSDGGRKLLLQLRLRLLEALQVPLSAGLRQRQQHRPCQPFISQWGDAGHQLWSEYGARWKILRVIGPFQLLTMAVRCWADKNVSSAAHLHSPGLDGIVFAFIWFCPDPAETEQSELANERNFNNLSHNSMDPAVMGAQQDTGGKSKPIVS